MLKALEFSYSHPVDIEFTVSVGQRVSEAERRLAPAAVPAAQQPERERARQHPRTDPGERHHLRHGQARADRPGAGHRLHRLRGPEHVRCCRARAQKLELARLIGRINQRLEGKTFILMGPGRWGSSNPDLGLKVGYADFYNTRALVEIGWGQGKNRPTLSYGTHFFQDLVESHIYPLAIFPGEPGNPFKQRLLRQR